MTTNLVQQKVKNISSVLTNYESFRSLLQAHYNDLKELAVSLQRDAEAVQEENRTLRIAIVGQVKSGKSSFLNALLFNGNDILPKAATPMTAALTVIRYAETLKAGVEYFSKEEWKTLVAFAKEYEAEYEQTRARLQRQVEEQRRNGGLFGRQIVIDAPITHESIRAEMIVGPDVEAAYEVVEMARKQRLDVSQYLGKKDSIEGVRDIEDLMGKLQNYVGVDGRFTPIVRNSTIYYNDERLKGIEVIDTPGINDPVISRGQQTKRFLGRCDVVFVLSYAGQFLDQADIELLAQNLPSKGVRHISLIGTQLDLVMLQEYGKHRDIGDLLDNIEVKLERYADRTFSDLQKSCEDEGEKEILERLKENLPPLFISSMAYNMGLHFHSLNANEQHYLNLYNNMYPGFTFDAETLLDLSNIEATGEILNKQKEEKEQILQERLQNLLDGAETGLRKKLSVIAQDTERKLHILRHEDIASLEEREKEVVKRLEKGRNKIEVSFENEILRMKQQLSMLITEMKQMSRRFSQTLVKTDSYTESYEVSTSKWWNPFSWGSSEIRTRTIPYRYANVYDTVDQIEEFTYESERSLKQTIMEMVDLPKLRVNMKEGALSLFDLSDEAFDVDSVILPIERAVNQITIPELEFGNENYANLITAQFGGQLRDSSVDSLQAKQREVIEQITKDFQKAVEAKSKEITDKLTAIQSQFVDSIIGNIKEDLTQLRTQLQDKKEAIVQYEQLTLQLERDLRAI